MGQIQNAISAAVGSVAVGAIAEQKTKGLKKEIAELTGKKAELDEYMALNAELIEDQQAELFKKEDKLKDVQARYSETKGQLAKANAEREMQSRKKQKEGYRQWVSTVSKKRGRR